MSGKLIGNWYITPHAIAKYQMITGKPWDASKQDLIAHSLSAKYKKEINPGISLYKSDDNHKMRFIVSSRFPGLPQLVTVL